MSARTCGWFNLPGFHVGKPFVLPLPALEVEADGNDVADLMRVDVVDFSATKLEYEPVGPVLPGVWVCDGEGALEVGLGFAYFLGLADVVDGSCDL